MGKWLIIILVLVIGIGAAGFYVLNGNKANVKMENSTNSTTTEVSGSMVTPVSHASMILNLNGQTIYNDPVGEAQSYSNFNSPNIILISDIHGDHFDNDTLSAISTDNTIIVVPQAVRDQMTEGVKGTIVVLGNGEKTTQGGVEIEAVPMYNVPESSSAPHTKGRGNGYILSAEGKRVYVAGDTGPTDEMKSLQNIDVAFIPMNLPYTMSVDEAAEAVIAFKPKVVHPYHYRGQDGLSDVNKFKELVEAGDQNIKVELLNFYPQGN